MAALDPRGTGDGQVSPSKRTPEARDSQGIECDNFCGGHCDGPVLAGELFNVSGRFKVRWFAGEAGGLRGRGSSPSNSFMVALFGKRKKEEGKGRVIKRDALLICVKWEGLVGGRQARC